MSVFSENLRSLRIKANLKQGALAEKAGIVQAAISQLENAVRPPTPVMLKKLCDALGVNPSELTGADMGTTAERTVLLRNMNKMKPEQLEDLARYSSYILDRQSKQDSLEEK
jgi:transcriptional regulator with XRE-family HTH domain